jgi:hypothetical protein
MYGKEKKLFDKFSYGGVYSVAVVIMFVVVSILALPNVMIAVFEGKGDYSYYPLTLVMIFNLVNALVIIVLPIYTTKKGETTNKAYMMAAGGILYTIGGIFLAVIWVAPADLFFEPLIASNYMARLMVALCENTVVYFLAGGTLLYAFGMLYGEKWRFTIPGIDFGE